MRIKTILATMIILFTSNNLYAKELSLEEVLTADPVDLLGCAECGVLAGLSCSPDCSAAA